MRKAIPLFILLLMLFAIEAMSQSRAAEKVPTTEEEFMVKLNEIAERCRQGYEAVGKQNCLWNQDPEKCDKDPDQCEKLKELQSHFTSKDYKETMEELYAHFDQNVTEIVPEIKKGNLSDPKVRREISEKMQALASTCAGSVKSLKGLLNPMKKLYIDVFKEACSPAA